VLENLVIDGQTIKPGERKKIFLRIAALYDYTDISIPIEVIRGKVDGPILFISAAIHGDEINGVEIVKRVLKRVSVDKLKGTLIAIPIVNVFGFNNLSRYLPDRRDLNRSFPGQKNGSLASRLASIFMKEIVNKCTHGIDLHTGAVHRTNLPQIRACLDNATTKTLAKAFGVPVVIDSSLRDGSLREAARRKGIPMLLFEGGEALRFEESIIRSGVKGCISTMRSIGLLPKLKQTELKTEQKTFIANDSYWVRAPHSGSFLVNKHIGARVYKGDVLAKISDPFGESIHQVEADKDGIIIGMTKIPLVSCGDAMFHIATFTNTKKVRQAIELYDELI